MSQGSQSSVKLSGMEYRVVKPLGQGAGSSVFKINDVKKGGYYALKIVKRQGADEDDAYIAQALQEAEVGPRLNHPSLMKIYDHRVKKSWFKVATVELLMEFVDGRTLDELEMPEWPQLVLMFANVASALQHMHRRKVYHGDLKPGNIMLTRNGQVKVIDFGTAWIADQVKGRVQGTPQYMAPEQARDKVVNDKTDLFNLGATMYRMFTGHYVNASGIPGDDAAVVGPRAKIRSLSKLAPHLPGTLSETIMACLNASPDSRPANASEVEAQLTAVARHLGLKVGDLKGLPDEEEEEEWASAE